MIDTIEYITNKFGIHKEIEGKMPVVIPNFGRNNLAALFNELKFSTGAEIGVKSGEYSAVLCNENPNAKIYSIDPWYAGTYFEHGEPHIDGDGLTIDQGLHEGYYEKAKKILSRYPNSTIIRNTSLNAIKMFGDNSLDFVYIDGNHDFQNCTNDIHEWSFKVRKGGIIAGHDYTTYRQQARIHVKYVVDGYTKAYAIKPWFILGSQEKTGEEIRDPSRSWFWAKQ
jgi:hypothetical protein